MFRRDEYDGDYTRNYFPQESYEHYKKDFYQPSGKGLQ